MPAANINKNKQSLRVIVAPLDWGLGHATRCIPLIRCLQNEGCTVFIAAHGAIASLLENEFNDITIFPLDGYNVRYSKNKYLFGLTLIFQGFKIRKAIRKEYKILKQLVDEHQISLVISDNRFGFHSSKVPSVFITHQLNIKTGNSLLDKFARKINYHFINRFSQCWVPDNDKGNTYAGNLSHPAKMPQVPVKYLGLLSRMKRVVTEKKYDFLFLISGPEPQRSMFENLVLKISANRKKIAIVRGLPQSNDVIQKEGCTVFNHLESSSLNHLICSSDVVICRSGYSSVMDLITLGKKAILVPTPGQTEQEYLAEFLFSEGKFKFVLQENLSENIFEIVPFQPSSENNLRLELFVKEFLESIRHL